MSFYCPSHHCEPIFPLLFSKDAAKVILFFELCKRLQHFFAKKVHFSYFLPKKHQKKRFFLARLKKKYYLCSRF